MTNLFKNIFGTPFKHKKLCDDWGNMQTSVSEGVTFPCRDLGSTVVTEAQNEVATAEAIRRVIHLVRATHIKPKRVALHVSSKGVKVRDAETGQLIRETDISDIAYCSADSQYNHVIAFIANGERNAFDCFAYLCQSSKIAQTVAIGIAHAFNMAYNESWQAECEESTETKNLEIQHDLIDIESTNSNIIETKKSSPNESVGINSLRLAKNSDYSRLENQLCDWAALEENVAKKISQSSGKSDKTNWAEFEEERKEELLKKFTNLGLNGEDKKSTSPLPKKPPQRCKINNSFSLDASTSTNTSPRLSTIIKLKTDPHIKESTNTLISKNSPKKPESDLSHPLVSIITAPKKLDEADVQPSPLVSLTNSTTVKTSFSSAGTCGGVVGGLFSDLENIWKNKTEWETFDDDSPSESSFSLDLCHSPVGAKPSETFQWTSFTD